MQLDQLTAQADLAACWATHASEQLGSDLPLVAQLRLYLTARRAERIVGDAAGQRSRGIADRFNDRAAAAGDYADQLLRGPAEDVLDAALDARTRGIAAPALAEFVRRLSRASHVAGPTASANSLRLRLRQLGAEFDVLEERADCAAVFGGKPFHDCTTDDISAVECRVWSATLFGTRPLPPDVCGPLREAFTALCIHQFRRYDLRNGCRLFGCLCMVSDPDPSFLTSVIGFLLLQQRPDGTFGYYGRELSRLGVLPAWKRVALVEAPTTLACLTALADAEARLR